jgi:hypothetical protein
MRGVVFWTSRKSGPYKSNIGPGIDLIPLLVAKLSFHFVNPHNLPNQTQNEGIL